MKKIIPILLIGLCLYSCQTLLLKIISKKSITKQVKVLERKADNRTVVFMPMIHVGKKEYFESAKPIIDSLRALNYKIYYESVVITDSITKEETILYEKKARKIMGFSFDNKEATEKSYGKPKKYITQDYNMMGLTQNDKILDLGINRIIDSIEKNNGVIKLSDCDINTPLNAAYKCENTLGDLNYAFTNTYRDPYIIDQVLKDENEKIVLIYGKMHWYSIYPDLIKNDFKLIKGKI